MALFIRTSLLLITLAFLMLCCDSGERSSHRGDQEVPDTTVSKKQILDYYEANKGDGKPSVSYGTAAKGSLDNGKLMPFYGSNFEYFDEWSYLNGRAFVNGLVKESVLEAYAEMQQKVPGRKFYIMECSNRKGGKLFPHHTHQNGLSVDFMMPKLKGGKPYIALDTIGTAHYWLSFNDRGVYAEDTTIQIDFDLIAEHLLVLEEKAGTHSLKISKVIFKIEMKDELFSTPNGKKLKEKGIYFAKTLTPQVNELHDEHYHVDFEVIKP